MKYSVAQAEKLARQIRDRFGRKISEACLGTVIPPAFMAGLISVEAGKDRNGQLREQATRFEVGVYSKLRAVKSGARASWSHIRTADIKDASDEALKNLSTSFGLTQIMGWHTIHNLNCTVAQLRDPDQHLLYAAALLTINAQGGDFQRKEYIGEFKQWNSGTETGKTYDPDYIHNASAVMSAYERLLAVPHTMAVEPNITANVAEDIVVETTEDAAKSAADTAKGLTTSPDKPKSETEGTPPPAPAMEIIASRPSLKSVAASIITFLLAPLSYLGIDTQQAAQHGIEFAKSNFGLAIKLAFAFALIVLAVWIWNRAMDRANGRTLKIMDAAADQEKNNLRLV